MKNKLLSKEKEQSPGPLVKKPSELRKRSTSLWGTKTFPHYLVIENHLDLKDEGLEWPLCFFVYQGGVKKKKNFLRGGVKT